MGDFWCEMGTWNLCSLGGKGGQGARVLGMKGRRQNCGDLEKEMELVVDLW